MPEKVYVRGREVSADLLEIIMKRIGAMPTNIKIAVLGTVLAKEDILRAIKENSPVGQELLAMEIDYYKDLIRD